MLSILGLSAHGLKSASVLLRDGEVIAASSEGAFTRRRNEADMPERAVDFCLRQGGLSADQLDFVAFFEKPLARFERVLESVIAFAPGHYREFKRTIPVWLQKKIFLPRELRALLGKKFRKKFVFTHHHEAHAASAFFPSPFEEAAILTIDGAGEWATSSIGKGKGNQIELIQEQRFPHSLGHLYYALAAYCGFEADAEARLMGLSTTGEAKYFDLLLEEAIDLKEDGSFRLKLDAFLDPQGRMRVGPSLEQRLGKGPRRPNTPMEDHYRDVAASAQKLAEEIILRTARHAHQKTGLANLCLAGGVAMNSLAMGRLLREGPFEKIWIQPAAGNDGGALGAALFVWHQLLKNERVPGKSAPLAVGDSFDDEAVRIVLEGGRVRHERAEQEAVVEKVATALAEGKKVAWFQGKMEFGAPFGSRCLLADPRDPRAAAFLSGKVRFQDEFQRHELVALASRREELLAADGQKFSQAEGCEAPVKGLGDGQASIRWVDPERDGLFGKLLERFHAKTGCPALLHDGLALGWDHLARGPEEAYRVFMTSNLDLLSIGGFLAWKDQQPAMVAGDSLEVYRGKAACPKRECRGELTVTAEKAKCGKCGQEFPVTDNIPQLFWPHEKIAEDTDVTNAVKAFYEETPFPNYNDHDSVRSLMEKSRQGIYGRALESSIPHNASVLEVGCGTGQLSNYLGIACRRVIGADMCLNSLRLGEQFRSQHGLNRVRFLQMNLFRPALADEQFDVVLCNGVLHHTADPKGGYAGLVPLVKPGGHIVIGLYNTYGRLATDARRFLFRITGGRFHWIDPILRKEGLSKGRTKAWFNDQYRHPHESKHTFGEVLEWFRETGIEFVRGIPALVPSSESIEGKNLFEPQPAGTKVDHCIVQALEIFSKGSQEGGFFVMIGRKPEKT